MRNLQAISTTRLTSSRADGPEELLDEDEDEELLDDESVAATM